MEKHYLFLRFLNDPASIIFKNSDFVTNTNKSLEEIDKSEVVKYYVGFKLGSYYLTFPCTVNEEFKEIIINVKSLFTLSNQQITSNIFKDALTINTKRYVGMPDYVNIVLGLIRHQIKYNKNCVLIGKFSDKNKIINLTDYYDIKFDFIENYYFKIRTVNKVKLSALMDFLMKKEASVSDSLLAKAYDAVNFYMHPNQNTIKSRPEDFKRYKSDIKAISPFSSTIISNKENQKIISKNYQAKVSYLKIKNPKKYKLSQEDINTICKSVFSRIIFICKKEFSENRYMFTYLTGYEDINHPKNRTFRKDLFEYFSNETSLFDNVSTKKQLYDILYRIIDNGQNITAEFSYVDILKKFFSSKYNTTKAKIPDMNSLITFSMRLSVILIFKGFINKSEKASLLDKKDFINLLDLYIDYNGIKSRVKGNLEYLVNNFKEISGKDFTECFLDYLIHNDTSFTDVYPEKKILAIYNKVSDKYTVNKYLITKKKVKKITYKHVLQAVDDLSQSFQS